MSAEYAHARAQMVEQQLAARDIKDQRVLEAMHKVERHQFVEPRYCKHAYADRPLPIGSGQTISQPYIVAKMLAWLQIEPSDKVLEIGTGSGYQTALLAKLAQQVISVERIPALADQARHMLADNVITNVEIHTSDGSLGWPAAAPYDAILVSAAGPHVPHRLLKQLQESAYLVIPVGQSGHQRLDRWQLLDAEFIQEKGPSVAFVPLIGQDAWQS
jgi:protein-L-isoaspartate(D-aspartate) O-methyltransferase